MRKFELMKVHATKEGKLYVLPSELFQDPEVQQMVKDLKNSSIYKDIQKRKKSSREGSKAA